MKTDPRVDQYIAKAPAFAQPILSEVRKRVGQTCPSAEETIKWNVPFFLVGGQILASMAAFKKHTKVGVWTGMKPDMVDVADISELTPAKEYAAKLKAALAHLGGEKAAPKKTTRSKATTNEPAAKKAPAPAAKKKAAPTAKKAPKARAKTAR